MMHNKKLVLLIAAQLACTAFGNSNETEAVFTNIYEKNFWGNKESVSGPGSTLKETEKIRKEMPGLFKRLNITSLLDAPCGDFNWLKHVNMPTLQQYIGVDIVEDIIEKNIKTYAQKNRTFFHNDILSDQLPSADAVMCRDCLVHFPFNEIWTALENFKKTGARYLITTTFTGCTQNKDIPKVGGWRPLNLQLAPFNFPQPIALINEEIKYDNPVYVTKCLAVYDLNEIKVQKKSPIESVTKKGAFPSFDKAMTCHDRDCGTYRSLIDKNHAAQPKFQFAQNQYEDFIQNQEYAQKARIPKIIHQIWIGPKPFPDSCKKWQKSWLKLNPDWQFKVWTNEDVKTFKLHNQKYYDEEKNWGAKSDILRYEILERFGGVYVDVDFECIKPFDWLHHCCDFYAGILEVKRLHGTARLANGIIACSPHHPLMQKLVSEIPNYRNRTELLKRVGPDFFTDVVHKNIKNMPGNNVLLPSNFFFSWSLDSVIVQPETMAIHYYAGTWHE